MYVVEFKISDFFNNAETLIHHSKIYFEINDDCNKKKK